MTMWSDLLDNNVSFSSVGIIRFVEYLEIKGIWLYFVCRMGCKANNANTAYLDVVRHISMSGMWIMAIKKTGSSVECFTKHTKLWIRFLNIVWMQPLWWQTEIEYAGAPFIIRRILFPVSWGTESVVECVCVFQQYIRRNKGDSFSPLWHG